MNRSERALAELNIWLEDKSMTRFEYTMFCIGKDVLTRHYLDADFLGGDKFCIECIGDWPCNDVKPWLDFLAPENDA